MPGKDCIPPCDTCLPKEPDEEDQKLANIYIICKNQRVFDPIKKVSILDIGAVCQVIDIFSVKDKEYCLKKIIELSNENI